MLKKIALLLMVIFLCNQAHAQSLTPDQRPHKGFATQILNSVGVDHIDISKWPFRAVPAGSAVDNTAVFNLIQTLFPGMPMYVPPSTACFGVNNISWGNYAHMYGATGVLYSQLNTPRSCITAAAGATQLMNPNGFISQEIEDIDVICDTAGGTGNSIRGIAGGSTNMHMIGGSVRFCGNGNLGDGTNITHTFQSFGTVFYGGGQTNSTANVENMVDSQFYSGYNVLGFHGWDFPAGANSNQIIGVKTEFNIGFGFNFQDNTKDNVVIGGVVDNNTRGCASIGAVFNLKMVTSCKRNGRGSGGTFTGTGTYGQNAQIYFNGGSTNVQLDIMTHTGVNDNGSGTLGPPYAVLFNNNTDKFVTLAGDYTGNTLGPVLYNVSASPTLLVSPAAQGYYPMPFAGEHDLSGVMTLQQITTAAAPTIANVGTGGAVTWSYKAVACSAPTYCSPASTAGSTTTGNATLTTSNYNTITVVPVKGAMFYNIYRTVVGTTPSTTGKIGTIYGQDLVLNDTALAGDSGTAPTTNTTAYFLQNSAATLAASTALFQNTMSNSGALTKNAYFQNSAGGGGSGACITFGTYTTWTVSEPISICGLDDNFSNDLQIRLKATGSNNGADSEFLRLYAGNGHLAVDGGSIPTCGTGCASVTAGSTDVRGSFTTGSAITAATLNFNSTWAAQPTCTISDNSTATTADIATLSTTVLTANFAIAVTSAKVYYICIQ